MTAALDRLERAWAPPPGILGWLGVVSHKQISLRYIATAFAFFLVGGVGALLIRAQLAVPENDLLGPERYNQVFTLHGSTMMFLFAVPMVEGLGGYLVPLMIGARDLAFPRLNAFGYWCFLFGGLLLYSGLLFGEVSGNGWFAYVPLSGPEYSPGMGQDFWLLGITLAEISALVAAIELVVSILKLRAPGMSLNRMPVFVWAILVVSLLIIVAFPPLIVGTLLLELDRSVGTRFFDPGIAPSALLWQHLFWIFGHPEVYIQFLPAAAVLSTVIPTFARRPIVAYMLVVLSLIATAILGYGLWVHHMFATGLPLLALAFFTASSLAVSIPSGIQVFAWIATLWGSRPAMTTSMLFALGAVVTFVLGGITGVMVALVPLDWQVHDSFFVVAHFHYVLIGGVVFPVFAGLFYWFPKFTGRLLSESLGRASFWLIFVGFHVTFFPMHIVGINGMPRRVYTYDADLGWDLWNMVETIGAFTIAAGVLVFLVNVVLTMWRGRPAEDDPWGAGTLEWSMPSPPPNYNFAVNPVVRGRYPLWEPEPPGGEEEPILGAPRRDARQLLVTGMLDAEPQAIVQIPAASHAPLLLAIAVAAVFVGALLKSPLLIGAAAAAALVVAASWAWPARGEPPRETRGDGAGLPYQEGGRYGTTEWVGMLLVMALLGSMLLSLLGSYYYLRSGVPEWPPEGVEAPGLVLPAVMALALAGALAAMGWAHSAARRDRRRLAVAGLMIAFVLGAAFVVLLLLDQARMEVAIEADVYASLFYVLGWAAAGLAGIGAGMNVFALARSRQPWTSAHGATAVEHVAQFWYFAAPTAGITLAVLYLSPHVG